MPSWCCKQLTYFLHRFLSGHFTFDRFKTSPYRLVARTCLSMPLSRLLLADVMVWWDPMGEWHGKILAPKDSYFNSIKPPKQTPCWPGPISLKYFIFQCKLDGSSSVFSSKFGHSDCSKILHVQIFVVICRTEIKLPQKFFFIKYGVVNETSSVKRAPYDSTYISHSSSSHQDAFP